MKMKLRYILTSVMMLVAVAGCDVHEFPEDDFKVHPFELHLNFDFETTLADMPLYKEILYYTRAEKESVEDYDMRYVIKAFRMDNVAGEIRTADTTIVVSKSDITNPNHSIQLNLEEGVYTFRVWSDYVKRGSHSDNYYNASNFEEIILVNKQNHAGSSAFREAFRGVVTAEVSPECNAVHIEMIRPMGKFKFISTDMEEFCKHAMQKFDAQSLDIDAYRVVFRYNTFMPCSFNMFTDKAADSWRNVSFSSRMTVAKNEEILLGYDYAFVDKTKTTLSISVEIYEPDGELLSASEPIDVPRARNRLTVVKGAFLTSRGSGGISINPGYEGDDYNMEI